MHHLRGNAIPASHVQDPWAILTKFCAVDEFLGPFSEAKFQHYTYRNVGLNISKIRDREKFEFSIKICP